MTGRYDLDKMLKEIEEDNAMESESQKGKVTQDDIQKLIKERQKPTKDKE